MTYRNLTSMAITEIDGLKILAISYDEIDETGRKIKDNIRESRVLVKTRDNNEILGVINKLEEYSNNLMNDL
ncbi:hypothetical protein [Clostridium baratii]|uniref:hypothetical protein n=1 Tax=Clostridium baratii TaxID=1561 RepID=UPI0030D350F3